MVTLVVDAAYGEHVEVHESADGFASALAELVPGIWHSAPQGRGTDRRHPGDLDKKTVGG
jgi:hypothetical protein